MNVVPRATYIQSVRYANVAAFALVLADYVGTLQREIDLVWRPKWNFGSLLFLMLRYSTLAEFGIIIYMQAGPNIPFDQCTGIYLASTLVCFLGISVAQAILCLRTYALWGNNRLVGVILSLAWILNRVLSIVGIVSIAKTTKFGQLPGIPLIGCFVIATGKTAGRNFSVILAVETLIFVITLWACVSQQGFFQSTSRLAHIIYRDSLIFYAYLFVIGVANVTTIFIAPPALVGLFMVLQHGVHCICGTRIVLNVRGSASNNHNATKEHHLVEDLESFDAYYTSSRLRADKAQHSVLDISEYVKESDVGKNLGEKIQA